MGREASFTNSSRLSVYIWRFYHNLQSVLQLKQLRAGGRGMGGVTFMNDLWQINFEFEKFPSINTQNMKK
jgi:hypothetical protein